LRKRPWDQIARRLSNDEERDNPDDYVSFFSALPNGNPQIPAGKSRSLWILVGSRLEHLEDGHSADADFFNRRNKPHISRLETCSNFCDLSRSETSQADLTKSATERRLDTFRNRTTIRPRPAGDQEVWRIDSGPQGLRLAGKAAT
jgi:hypothetical protein